MGESITDRCVTADRPGFRARTTSVADTEALAARLAANAQPGWVIGLQGDLGAGKTAFTRGFARGVGFSGRVHSPTFALLNEYLGGRWPLHHLDLYRLHSAEDVRGAGLEEYLLRPTGITLVEWSERWLEGQPAPAHWRQVSLQLISENEREMVGDWLP